MDLDPVHRYLSPLRGWLSPPLIYPPLARWAAIFRRFAAGDGIVKNFYRSAEALAPPKIGAESRTEVVAFWWWRWRNSRFLHSPSLTLRTSVEMTRFWRDSGILSI